MAASRDALVESTIESLYMAVSDEEHWPRALEGIASLFDSQAVGIVRTPTDVSGVYDMRALNHDEETQRLYQEYYWTLDPTRPLTRDTPVGTWHDCAHLLDPKTTPSPEYTDFAIRHGIRFVAGGKVHQDERSCTILGLQRPADHKPFTPEAEQVFNRLGIHVGRASKLCTDLQRAELSKGLSLAALDAIEWPIYVLAPTGRVVLANRSGERQLEIASPFGMHADRLHCGEPECAAALEQSLREAAQQRASAFRFRNSIGHWFVRVLPVSGSAGTALVYASPAEPPPAPEDVLRQLWQFSKAEATIAFMLADGLSIKEIAYARDVSVNTVRAQVREIYRKTGARRQAELAKLLYGLPLVKLQ